MTAEYVYRCGTTREDLRGVTKFASGLWRTPAIVASTSVDYDGILSTWGSPPLEVFRCPRADFEAACTALGFGFHARIQGEDHRLVAVEHEEDADGHEDPPWSPRHLHDALALPPSFAAMWEQVGTCGGASGPPPTLHPQTLPEWCSNIRNRLERLSPTTDVALAAAWCVRELDALCPTRDETMGTAFTSPRGRVVLQWVVELLRLDTIANTMTEGGGDTVVAVNDYVRDLRAANPGVTHDPRGCLVFFARAPPATSLVTFMESVRAPGSVPPSEANPAVPSPVSHE
jgi:hypothetical protein